MTLLVLITSFFMISFTLTKAPLVIGCLLILLRACYISMMALRASWWYSYVLFLVYVGGLLVIFIYICLVRRNYSLRFNYLAVLPFITLITYIFRLKPDMRLGVSLFDGGGSLVSYPRLYLGLVILLLCVLFLIVRSAGGGAIL